MKVFFAEEPDGIVIYASNVLVTHSDDPVRNGLGRGWIAVRAQGDEWQRVPFGFGDTPDEALADLEAQL